MAGNTNIQNRRPSRISSETVEVFTPADLPAPVAGLITLTKPQYKLKKSIQLSDKLKVPDGADVEISADNFSLTIEYTGNAEFISVGPGGIIRLINHQMILSGFDSSLFKLDGSSIVARTFDVAFTGVGSQVGLTSNDPFDSAILDTVNMRGLDGGLVVEDCSLFRMINTVISQDPTAITPVVTFTGDNPTIEILDSDLIAGVNASMISLASVGTGNVSLGRLRNSVASGAPFFDPLGINETDPRVVLNQSAPQKDSYRAGVIVVQGNVAVTSIPLANTWVDLNLGGVAFEGETNEGYTLVNATTGETRNDGLSPESVIVAVNITAMLQQLNVYEFRLLKNGVPTPDGVTVKTEVFGNQVAASSVAFLDSTFSTTDDLFRMQVQNLDAASDLTVQNMVFLPQRGVGG